MEKIEFLQKNLSFWNRLTKTEQHLLEQNAIEKSFCKGEVLHNSSEGCLGMVLVKSGQIRAYLLSEDGREITLMRLFQGDICVLSASCILDAITFEVSIDAEEDSQVVLLPSNLMHQLMEQTIHVEKFTYQLIAASFSDVMWTMQQILFMSFDKRLAIFLLDEVAKNHSDALKITHEQIAKYMGSAREVVSRMLKYFEGEGIVALSRGGIQVLDKKKLKGLLN